jgi:putative transposase
MPPIREFTTSRRNLPHWQSPGETYFLTWRVTAGRQLEPEDRTIALNAIRHWDGVRWFVCTAVVMPDHVHALVRPLPIDPTVLAGAAVHDLSELVKSVKGFSAYRINRRQRRGGTFWQDERYDRIVRDDREFEETWAYIRNNPVTAELVPTPEQYAWLHEALTAE